MVCALLKRSRYLRCARSLAKARSSWVITAMYARLASIVMVCMRWVCTCFLLSGVILLVFLDSNKTEFGGLSYYVMGLEPA